jgi:hypothetical protein
VSYTADYERQVEMSFAAWVQTAYPGTPIYYDGMDFNEPKDGPWFALFVLTGGASPASIGTDMVERITQVIHISVYMPIEGRAREAKAMAEAAARFFAYKHVKIADGHFIRYRSPMIKGQADAGKYRAIATVDGWRDVSITKPAL